MRRTNEVLLVDGTSKGKRVAPLLAAAELEPDIINSVGDCPLVEGVERAATRGSATSGPMA